MLSSKLSLTLVAVLLTISSLAQDSLVVDKRTNAFYSLNLGVLSSNSNGDNNFGLSLQGAMGFKINHTVGVGLGLGYEEDNIINTLPLFFQINGNFKQTQNTPSYYFNIGQSKVWLDEGSGKTSDANFIEIGLGYKWQLNNYKLFITSGWKLQRFSIRNNYGNQWAFQSDLLSFAPPPFSQKTRWEQQRVTVRFGLEF